MVFLVLDPVCSPENYTSCKFPFRVRGVSDSLAPLLSLLCRCRCSSPGQGLHLAGVSLLLFRRFPSPVVHLLPQRCRMLHLVIQQVPQRPGRRQQPLSEHCKHYRVIRGYTMNRRAGAWMTPLMSSWSFFTQCNKFCWFDYTKIWKVTRKKDPIKTVVLTINLYYNFINMPKAQPGIYCATMQK